MTIAAPDPFLARDFDEVEALRGSFFDRVWRFVRHEPLGTFGMLLVAMVAVAGIGADWIAPYPPTENDFAAMTEAPSWAHLLGTDQFGRDMFSRIIFGARTALIVGLSTAALGGFSGLVVGVASAYFGGRLDLYVQRVLDVVMAFPLIIMALAVVAIFGTGVHNVIAAITIPLIPRCARVVRSNALAIREIPYIDAARVCGFGHLRIILRHMVPNVVAPFLIMLTTFVGQAILAEAGLSYLGLGVQEPVPAWGLMLQGGAEEFASTAPWIAIFPGLAIMVTVFGVNIFGDALRDVLDPKIARPLTSCARPTRWCSAMRATPVTNISAELAPWGWSGASRTRPSPRACLGEGRGQPRGGALRQPGETQPAEFRHPGAGRAPLPHPQAAVRLGQGALSRAGQEHRAGGGADRAGELVCCAPQVGDGMTSARTRRTQMGNSRTKASALSSSSILPLPRLPRRLKR